MKKVRSRILIAVAATVLSVPASAELFKLREASVIYDNGVHKSTRMPGISAGGTMSVNGNVAIQSVWVCENGQCSSIKLSGNYWVSKNAMIVATINGSETKAIVVNDDPLITHTRTGNYTEVDVWEPVDAFTRNVSNAGYTQRSGGQERVGVPGGLFGQIIEGL